MNGSPSPSSPTPALRQSDAARDDSGDAAKDAEPRSLAEWILRDGLDVRLQLQIHKPTNATADAQFLADHPDFAGISIKVTGTFNGTDFTFTSTVTTWACTV